MAIFEKYSIFVLGFVLLHGTNPLLATPRLTVNWASDWVEFKNHLNVPLSEGDPSVNQDGALIQLGYFTNSSDANLFAGDWVPLTLETTIGDTVDLSGYGDGYFSFISFFVDGSPFVPIYDDPESRSNPPGSYITQAGITIDSSNPPSGKHLAIRFFDGNWDEMQRYNTLSSPLWKWTALQELQFGALTLYVDALTPSDAKFEDPNNAFQTTITLQNAWDYGKRHVVNHWYSLFWFGHINMPTNSDWIYHEDHGWLYPHGDLPKDVWFYHQTLGWVWTNVSVYPWLYSDTDQDWLYFRKLDGQTWVYHYSNETWEQTMNTGASD